MPSNAVVLFYPNFEGASKWHWMPFPYLYLSPYLERDGFSVQVVDARVDETWRERLLGLLPDAMCLGVTSMTGPDVVGAMEAVQLAKELRPDLPVVWGGPHATVLPKVTVQEPNVDVVVVGQGEEVLLELCRRFREKAAYRDVRGIMYKDQGRPVATPAAPCVRFDHDLFPAYHLMEVERYRSHNNVVSLFSMLGCPFKCTFCTTGERSFQERTMPQVLREIDFLVKDLGFKNLFFQDGTFFLKKDRVLAIARHLLDLGPEVQWKAKARANSLLDYSSDELALLRDSGLVSVFFGLESGSPKILKIMRKGIDTSMAEKSAAICRDYDFEYYTSFMFAVPYEGVEDLKLTIAFTRRLLEINPKTNLQECIYLPLPGTPMYDMAIDCGFVPPKTLKEWSQRNISSRFAERTDVVWLPPHEKDEYIRTYNETFGEVRHAYEREARGEYVSPFARTKPGGAGEAF